MAWVSKPDAQREQDHNPDMCDEAEAGGNLFLSMKSSCEGRIPAIQA